MNLIPKMFFAALLLVCVRTEYEVENQDASPDHQKLSVSRYRQDARQKFHRGVDRRVRWNGRPGKRIRRLRLRKTTITHLGPYGNSGSYDCGGSYLTVEERKAITEKHNELRSQLAKGKAVNRDNTLMPRGKNIYALSYNCALEKQAQKYINRCQWEHSPQYLRPQAGENLYYYASRIIPDEIMKNAGINATQSWWDELKDVYPNNPSNEVNNYVLNSGNVGHFLAMAWGKTTSIGCGKSVCRKQDKTFVYIDCQYHTQGVIVGEKIYEIGEPCQKHSQCTTYPRSTCLVSQGLCQKPQARVGVPDPL